MSNTRFADYDKTRDLSIKPFKALCYAPFNTLYFDNNGNVRVCCHNGTFPVGNILESSIEEIWHGDKIKKLRDAMKAYEFGPGCQFCEMQTKETFNNAAMARFDRLKVPSDEPEWPSQLEFSISNSCNLECVMCRGFWSSAIRARREKLPPLPRHYGDPFFESLWKLLPSLQRMKFLGGEPFLITEYYRIWDYMIEHGLSIPCHVTTNGTQYNSKVAKYIDKIPFSFSISMDGVTKETVESVRVNAKFEEVRANAARFRDYAKQRGTSFSLTFCLMRMNWHEFGDYCKLADEWECAVGINTVVNPPQFGIYTLPREELLKVLKGMEEQIPVMERDLSRNRHVWFGELERIKARCLSGNPG